jgi:hypothetical protein
MTRSDHVRKDATNEREARHWVGLSPDGAGASVGGGGEVDVSGT